MCAAKSGPEKQNHQDILQKVGARLKALRIASGETNYEKFAFKHDISRSQLSRFERGEDLQLTSLLKVLQALEISLKDFFSEGFE